MNGVMIPCVSAGSNQVGASETWMPQVSCPSRAAARTGPGTAATSPRAARPRRSRRVKSLPLAEPLASRAMILPPLPLRCLQRDVFVGRGVWEACDQAEPRLADARSNTVEKGELPDRCKDCPLVHQLLHLVQDHLALLVVQFDRLLPIERVDVGVAAVDERAALDDVGFEAGRCVAKGAGTGQDDVFQGLLCVCLDKRGPFDRPQLHSDADRL